MIDILQLVADAEACNSLPNDAALANISFLAKKQQRLERAVARRAKLLELTQAKLARVSELELPDAMAAVGMATFALDDGYSIGVARQYFPNIPSPDSEKPELLARRQDCFQWMRDTKNGDLIKRQIVVEAGRGEEAKAERVMNGLDKAGIAYKNTESINGNTLKAFVKEQMERPVTEGSTDFPSQLFGVHVKRVATIKPAKKK